MNFINRAFKNVTRKFSKSILLVITFFVIGNFVIIGLGVANAAEKAKTLTRQKMRAVVTYGIDYNAVWEYAETIEDEEERNEFYEKNYPKIKLNDIKDVLTDSRVSTANAFISASQAFKTDEYDFVHLNNEAEQQMNNQNDTECVFDESNQQRCFKYYMPTHFVKANMFPNMIEFVDGGYEVVDGSFYSQEQIDNAEPVLLISKAFAEVNNLKVGDKYSFYISSPNELEYFEGLDATLDDLLVEFEIIGIFDHQSKITPDSSNFNYTYPYENPDNMLLMPGTSYIKQGINWAQKTYDYYAQKNPNEEYYQNPENRPSYENIENNSVNDVTFLLNDPLIVDEFVESYSKKLPQFIKLDANNEEFKRLSKPLDTLELYANFIIWLVVINAIIIISLVTALTLKTREYEIGVLLSIGASKIKIIGQFFVELALVAVLGFTLAIASGSIVANKVGQTVLTYQIQESDVDKDGDYYRDDSIWNNDYSTEVTLDDLVQEYNVTVSPIIIGEIYVLGLGIVLVSILIPSLMIMRFNPKKILMNQN